jgi:hypothetical protein
MSSVVGETLKGMYRVIWGPEEGRRNPASVIKEQRRRKVHYAKQ